MNTVNTENLLATRTIMTITHGTKPMATVLNFTNRELLEIYGADAVREINAGNRAIVTLRNIGGVNQLTVYDVILAAMTQNADLHKNCTGHVGR